MFALNTFSFKKLFILSVFTLFFVLVFSGNTQSPDNFSFNFNVYLSVSCEDNNTLASTAKGYLLEEMRKIPDVTTVKKGSEVFRIEVLLMETKPTPGIAYSICILSRLDISLLTPHIRNDEASKIIVETLLKRRLYAFAGNLVATSSLQSMQEICKDLILVFNSNHLEPTRQSVRDSQNWLNQQKQGEQ
jgi:hypothetical protein